MYREYPTFLPDELLEYLRKSRSDDPALTVEEVLAKHTAILKEWQDRNLDAPIPEENIYREVVSGETIQSRPEFKQLLRRIESPKIKAVLIVECARLGRPDLEEIGRLSKLFRYTNTMVITPQRIFDLRDEYDREQFERELMRGNDYLEYSKKVLNRGKELSLRQGYYINAVVPYGYTREWVYEGKRKRPTLAIVEEEAKVVRMIFDWYVNEEIGTMKISQRLNALGIPPRKGGLWKKSSISHILKNEHYIGKIVLKKHVKVSTVVDQEIITRCLFNNEFETVDGKHPPIVDEDLFHRANNKISKHISTKPNETLQNPFASILRCECGRVMRRGINRGKYRYLCDEQTFCGNASVQEKELTLAIIDILKQNLEELTAVVTDSDESKIEKHAAYVSLLESKYVEAEKKELSLWDKYSEEQMPKQVFDTLMAKCLEEKKNLENALETAHNNVPEHVDYKGVIASLHEAIEALSDDSVSASAKNKLLLSVVDKIVYRRGKAIRLTATEATARGVKPNNNGWYAPKFELDVYLKKSIT
jgi:DNA invertase Pin-like site-specific DNA recombinase